MSRPLYTEGCNILLNGTDLLMATPYEIETKEKLNRLSSSQQLCYLPTQLFTNLMMWILRNFEGCKLITKERRHLLPDTKKMAIAQVTAVYAGQTFLFHLLYPKNQDRASATIVAIENFKRVMTILSVDEPAPTFKLSI